MQKQKHPQQATADERQLFRSILAVLIQHAGRLGPEDKAQIAEILEAHPYPEAGGSSTREQDRNGAEEFLAWRRALAFGCALLVALGLGGFAAERSSERGTWIIVILACGIGAGFAAVSPVRRKHRPTHEGQRTRRYSSERQGYVATALLGIITVLSVEIATSFDINTPDGRWLHLFLVVGAAAGSAVLVQLFIRHDWSTDWLAAIAGALVALDGVVKGGSSGMAGLVAIGSVLVAVPAVIHQSQRAQPPSLSGDWYLPTYAAVRKDGWDKSARWGPETWGVSAPSCDRYGCSYAVAAATRFVLLPSRTTDVWHGVRYTKGNCEPADYVVEDAYDNTERLTLHMHPGMGPHETWFTLSDLVTGVALKPALEHNCVDTTSALLTVNGTSLR